MAFCGLAGYASFIQGDWLREIRSWQADEPAPGYFPDIYGEKGTTENWENAKTLRLAATHDDAESFVDGPKPIEQCRQEGGMTQHE